MSRYEFHEVGINLSTSIELQNRLEAFKRRATDLDTLLNMQKLGIQSVSIDRSNEDQPRIHGSIPEELFLESLYRRFRFFILNDENANYRRFLRLLSASSENELLHQFIRLERKEFLKSDILEYAFISARLQYKPEEIINYWFNSYYFHDQQQERCKLTEFEKTVTPDGAKVLLWQIVWRGSLSIRNMARLVKLTSPDNPIVQIPVLAKLYGS